ncbi:MAG TPA: M23 family metallopeptidase [Dissulfurispiraceae bacterium]|nr:M23 family metallopeptidase [Dissulfurispiraceae bacterium]
MRTAGAIDPALLHSLGLERMQKNDAGGDSRVFAREIETVLLGEFLKILLEQTSFGKDRTISTYMPFITTEVSRSLAERGTGVGDFFLRGHLGGTLTPPVTEPAAESRSAVQDEETVPAAGRKDREDAPQMPVLSLPVRGRITSPFGLRKDPFHGGPRHHRGIDIGVPEGTPVKSAAPGRVVFSGSASGYGNCVIIEHEDGMESLYAHTAVNYVQVGERVDRETILALSGSSGRSKGPHLHFEVRKEGKSIDPITFFG